MLSTPLLVYINARSASFASLLGLFILAFSGLVTMLAHAQERDLSPHSEARLISEVEHVAPGMAFTVALQMTMDQNWHSYWLNPGDAGLPTEVLWELPEGFEAGEIQWPYPERLDFPPLTSYGYSDEVYLLMDMQAPVGLTPGDSVTLGGLAKWLICEEVCLPAQQDVAVTLPVKNTLLVRDPHWAEAFDAARSRHPITESSWAVRAARDSNQIQIQVANLEGGRAELDGMQFFAAEKGVVHYAGLQQYYAAGTTAFLTFEMSRQAKAPVERLAGLLVAPAGAHWGDASEARSLWIDVPVEATPFDLPRPAPDLAEGAVSSIWMALLLAFAGGVLLNLMPCVFPVLSIKVLGFVQQAGEEKKKIRLHGIVFGIGVLVSFLALAGSLLALRAGGSQIGWGFQLQSPIIVALMALLMFGIGLNLMGVFEFGTTLMKLGGFTGQNRGGYTDSFFSGVLASIVATPCTAPFMGVALGFAMVQPAVVALAIFACLGIGMAMPYVLLSFLPRLLNKLPAPGAWMQTFKHVLAFPMFATVVWLTWVFGLQTSIDAVAFLLIGFVLLGLAGWIVGHWDIYTVKGAKRLITRLAALTALVGAVLVSFNGIQSTSEPLESEVSQPVVDTEYAWADYSGEDLASVLESGQPVFVDFTAAWCISCQVNKKLVLTKPRVMEAFEAQNVALFRADWTTRDDEITQALESFGRNGVPLYVYYPPNGQQPIILPEVLTQRMVLQAIGAAEDRIALSD